MKRTAAAAVSWWAAFGASIALQVGAPLRAAAPAPQELSQLMQQLAARPRAQATFVERKTLAVLSRPVESSGELLYEAPDRLEKRMLKPRQETLKMENGSLVVQRGRRTYRVALRDAPEAAPFIDTIRATLAGDLPALQRVYTLDFHASTDGWTLQMLPREAEMLHVIKRIRIAGVGSALRQVSIDSADGDRSVMDIRELPAP